MNMSTVFMSGRGCVALGGEDKDVTEEEGMFVAGGRRTEGGRFRQISMVSETHFFQFVWLF